MFQGYNSSVGKKSEYKILLKIDFSDKNGKNTLQEENIPWILNVAHGIVTKMHQINIKL